ncbi:MAG: MFS transporter [Sphingobacteriia bacterium]|nr:MFS transporter [Sphingobacteriia bacterium]
MFNRYTLWAFASIFYAYQYILRVLPNAINSEIVNKFNMGATELGQFSGIYYLGYVLAHIPIGIMLDKLSSRIVLSLMCTLTCLGTASLVFSDHYIIAILGRFLVGVGSSAAIIGLFKITRESFEENKYSTFMGIAVTIGLSGAIFGGLPLEMLLKSFGWQKSVLILIGIGIFTSICILIFAGGNKNTQAISNIQIFSKDIFHPALITISILAGLMVGPLEGFADVWSKRFLQEVYSLPPENASFIASQIFIGMCFGASILGYLARFISAPVIVILSGIIMTGAFGLSLSGSISPTTIIPLFISLGAFSAYQVVAISYAVTKVPASRAGVASSVANMIIMAFGYVFHTVIGYAHDYSSKITNNPKEQYLISMGIIPIALTIAVSGFIVIYLRDKHKLSVK